ERPHPEAYRERIAELVSDALEASAVSSPSDEAVERALEAYRTAEKTAGLWTERIGMRAALAAVSTPPITDDELLVHYRRGFDAVFDAWEDYDEPWFKHCQMAGLRALAAALHPGGETNGN